MAVGWQELLKNGRVLQDIYLLMIKQITCTNTSNYIDLAGVQLEVGDSYTEFEHIPFEANLRRCQRAFETNAPYGEVGNGGESQYPKI